MQRENSTPKAGLETLATAARAGGPGAALAARRAAVLAQRTDPALAREMLSLAVRLERVDPAPQLALARLHAEAGELDEAKRAARTVLTEAVDKAARARAAFMLGEIARVQGDRKGAREHFHTTLKIEESLLAANRADPTAARWYARARGRLAELDDGEGAHERARAGAEGALAMLRASAAHTGETPVLAADLADAEMRLAAMELDDNQPASARRRLSEAIGRYEALAITEKDEPHWRAVIADAWTLAAEADFMRNAPDNAREAMDTALQARLRLAAHNLDESWALAGTWRIRAALRAALGDNDAAADSLTQARRLAETLLKRAADKSAAARFYVHTLLDQADHALRTQALADANDAADAARQQAETMALANGEEWQWFSDAAACWDRLGEVARQASDHTRTQDAFARAVEFRRIALDRGPREASVRGLAAALVRHGDAALAANGQRTALAAFAESAALRRSLFNEAPESSTAAHALAVALERLGLAAQAMGDRVAAQDAWSEELMLADRIFPDDDDNPEGMRFRAIVEAHLAELGGMDSDVHRRSALHRLDILAGGGGLSEAEAALRRRLWGG